MPDVQEEKRKVDLRVDALMGCNAIENKWLAQPFIAEVMAIKDRDLRNTLLAEAATHSEVTAHDRYSSGHCASVLEIVYDGSAADNVEKIKLHSLHGQPVLPYPTSEIVFELYER